MSKISAKRVRLNFNRAKRSYAQNARIQDVMGDKLLELSNNLPRYHDRILEFGANTGLFTSKILKRFESREFLCTDIIDTESELNALAKKITFKRFDFNDFLTHIREPKDLILSNATLQWCNSEHILKNIHQIVRPGGYFVFSTFGENNLKEIKFLTGFGLDYLPYLRYQSALEGFELLKITRESYSLEFPSAIDALYHLKYTGVNSLANGFYISKKMLSDLALYFKNTLTYDAIFIVARKVRAKIHEK